MIRTGLYTVGICDAREHGDGGAWQSFRAFGCWRRADSSDVRELNVFGRSGRFCGMSPRVSWAGLPYVPSAGPMACYGNTHMITYCLLKTMRMTFLKPQRTPQHTSAPQHSCLAVRCVLQPIHCSQAHIARLGPAVRRQVCRCNHLHVRRTSFSILLCWGTE